MTSKKTVWGDIGFIISVGGIAIILIPFFKLNPFLGTLMNGLVALFAGIIGMVLSVIQPKQDGDQVTKTGIILSPIAILLGIINIIFSFVSKN